MSIDVYCLYEGDCPRQISHVLPNNICLLNYYLATVLVKGGSMPSDKIPFNSFSCLSFLPVKFDFSRGGISFLNISHKLFSMLVGGKNLRVPKFLLFLFSGIEPTW